MTPTMRVAMRRTYWGTGIEGVSSWWVTCGGKEDAQQPCHLQADKHLLPFLWAQRRLASSLSIVPWCLVMLTCGPFIKQWSEHVVCSSKLRLGLSLNSEHLLYASYHLASQSKTLLSHKDTWWLTWEITWKDILEHSITKMSWQPC